MELTSQIQSIILLDSDDKSRSTAHKCIQYLWAGHIEVSKSIEEAQQKLSESDHLFNLFILSFSDFEDIDLASWLLGIGFKGQVVLMLDKGERAPSFIPCDLLKTCFPRR
ncbi:hypothetical protein CJF42_19855 [Pseudoalteromonas sp. NBT06-2]|uniref:hypothetical protein n=1 Tax=Pseudoalteromonas sp. NBT06-2 TaxID=2025950 RepID=UPI000BA76D39|nr:hypothetical protein [Pseudoalteromonas sp. NBT06-2]PAJ72659.1 hypothetical protein CJF42_19855 [Pseudoalteromonas sp. NBT06-2]